MKYIDVEWHHENTEYPCRLISELDETNYEVRKIEIFRDGTVGIASEQKSTLDTRLGEMEVPDLEEINLSPEFNGKEIPKTEFDALWAKYGDGDS